MRRVLACLTALAAAGVWAPAAAHAAVGVPGTADVAGHSGPTAAGTAPVPTIAPIPRGVVHVLATVPAPGVPALPLVDDGTIWEGTYTASSGSDAHSHVFAFGPTGALLADHTIADQPAEPYGIQVANTTASGQLVLLDDTSGRVLLMNRTTGATTLYATIPDIPLCSAAGASAECSDASSDATPEPDYAAWGPDGSLYVTDYQQAVIWRIPPHGGTPSIWLGGSELDGGSFGTAGIWMEPDHHTLLVDQASNLGGGGSDPVTGKLYSVQISADGSPGPLKQLWASDAAALPDGFAVAQSGDIYLAQIGPAANDIVELSPSGQLITSFGSAITGDNGSAIPFDEPSGVAFFDDDLIIANQSYLAGDTAHMALLALGTGEAGAAVYVPRDAGPAAATRPVTPTSKKKPTQKKRPTKKKPTKRQKKKPTRNQPVRQHRAG